MLCAYIKVDEAGTTAAAGTGPLAAMVEYSKIRFDRPFLFFIRELRSGLILFMGRIADPTAH